MRIEIVSIPVTDQDRAKAFYAEALGFEVVADQPFGEDQRWVQLLPPGGGATITLTTWFDDYAPGTVRGLLLKVDDIRSAIADLRAQGVTVEDPYETPWGWFAGFADPDGNRWSLHG
jgi:catechol 2,3-dioxygenase-like lactoylglutathione lyase family enzyme